MTLFVVVNTLVYSIVVITLDFVNSKIEVSDVNWANVRVIVMTEIVIPVNVIRAVINVIVLVVFAMTSLEIELGMMVTVSVDVGYVEMEISSVINRVVLISVVLLPNVFS